MFRKINVFETKYKIFSFIQFLWGPPYPIYKTMRDFEVSPRNTYTTTLEGTLTRINIQQIYALGKLTWWGA